MPGKNVFMKTIPIFFIFIGALLGLLPLRLYKNNSKIVFWNAYLILQILMWLTVGIVLKYSYTAMFTDDLTKLWNRRFLIKKLLHEVKKIKQNKPLSLAIVDIDNFKRINDNYGHLYGDKVIMMVAKILHDNIRSKDIVGRWGGEEFIIILPNTDAEGAKVVFERIRKIIEKKDFGCKITISGGIAFQKEPIQVEKLIEKADMALYNAKKRKNMVSIYRKQ